MEVKIFDNCTTCDVSYLIDSNSISKGRHYYSCNRCRKWDRKSNGYVPFEFLNDLKRKMKDTKLVNLIWSKIWEDVISIGRHINSLDCVNSKNLDEVDKLFKRFESEEYVTTSKILIDGEEYVWIASFNNE